MFIFDPSFDWLFPTKPPTKITGFFYQSSGNYPEKLQYEAIDADEEPIVDPPSSLGFLDSPVFLYNSCNGLLHWATSQEDEDEEQQQQQQQQHFISNPLTNKSIPLQWPIDSDDCFASGLAFDPSSSDHFRVIVLVVKSRNKVKPMIFSSQSMEWVEGDQTLALKTRNKPFCGNRGVFLNGFLYWELKKNSLLAYNVEDQSVRLMNLPLPNKLAKKLAFVEPGCLGESEGKLHYCRMMGTVLSVWVYVETQDSLSTNDATPNWVHKHLVNLSEAIHQTPSIKPFGCQALALVDDCEAVLVSVEGKIISCRLETGIVDEVYEVRRNGFRSKHVHTSEFFPFVHSQALANFP